MASNTTTWSNLSYPALNGDSVLIPYTTTIEFLNNGEGVFWVNNDCTYVNYTECPAQACVNINSTGGDTNVYFDEIITSWVVG